MNLAQLPVAMRQLLVVLIGHENTGSFATAGIASAACGIGLALTAPVAGRLLARLGDRPVLLATGFAHLAALVGLALATEPAVFVLLAAAAGLTTPPALSSGRSLLPVLVPGPALTRAYAVNAIGQEILYVGGPLAVTLSLTLTGPSGALLAFGAIGTTALVVNAALVPGRAPAATDAPGPGPRTGRPAFRTLVAVHFAYMIAIGAMWVLVPAFAAGAGHPDQAGLLITLWSVGSLAGGLLLAARGRRGALATGYLVLLGALAGTSLGLLLPRTVPQLAVAITIFGLALAPWLAVTDELMARATPPPHTAAAFGWLQTAGQLGVAIGAGISGRIHDRYGANAAFLLVSGALLTAFGLALYRRRWLRTVTDPAQPPTVPAPAEPVGR